MRSDGRGAEERRDEGKGGGEGRRPCVILQSSGVCSARSGSRGAEDYGITVCVLGHVRRRCQRWRRLPKGSLARLKVRSQTPPHTPARRPVGDAPLLLHRSAASFLSFWGPPYIHLSFSDDFISSCLVLPPPPPDATLIFAACHTCAAHPCPRGSSSIPRFFHPEVCVTKRETEGHGVAATEAVAQTMSRLWGGSTCSTPPALVSLARLVIDLTFAQ